MILIEGFAIPRRRAFFLYAMPLINSKYLALLLLFCVGAGCKSFSRLMNKSGTVYTVEIETAEPNKDEIVERAVRVTQSRINAVGLDGEVSRVADKPNQMSVKIYGANDAERIRKFLFTANQLELKEVGGAALQVYSSKESAAAMANDQQEVLPFEEGNLPDSSGKTTPQKFIVVYKTAVVTGANIRDANAISRTGGASDYIITFSLDADGAQKFGDWTSKNVGRYLAIVLDKKAVSAPIIRGPIFDTGQIEGRFTKTTAEDLALSLKSGYLSATMKVLEEKPFN
jgi:preprotein translocase subunit SecD